MEDGSMDTISHFPQPILQHILSFLPQNDAVRTSVLSKSWLHLWSTRPNFEFFESDFTGNEHQFLPVVDKILQFYHDHKVSIQDFTLSMIMRDFKSISLLQKWIPMVVSHDASLKSITLLLNDHSMFPDYFDLPSEIFKLESLEKLHLKRCLLGGIDPLDGVMFKRLKTLALTRVCVADRTLEMIMSSCPLIEFLALRECEGLSTIRMNDTRLVLRYFEFSYYHDCYHKEDEDRSIEIDVPSLETIVISRCPNWFYRDKCFPNLKSLCLNDVRLSMDFFDCFSGYFPCVEELNLRFCYGFEDFHLQSGSIKLLIIAGMAMPVKAVIDAPNIVEFEYQGKFTPSISFVKTSKGWKSNVTLQSNMDLDIDASTWLVKLNELIEGLSQSEISLEISQYCSVEDPPAVAVPEDFIKPVVVEDLHLGVSGHSSSYLSAFMNGLFCVCRPRKIRQFWYANARGKWERQHNEITEYLCKIFRLEREEEMRCCSWRQDLEEVSLEECDDDDKQWHPVEATSWLEYCASLSIKDFEYRTQQLRFRLKWRELSGCLTN